MFRVYVTTKEGKKVTIAQCPTSEKAKRFIKIYKDIKGLSRRGQIGFELNLLYKLEKMLPTRGE
tara:strand:- start:62375 stop:62566 length:192 start_codon:yes stop_codon:yes gene_type:complete